MNATDHNFPNIDQDIAVRAGDFYAQVFAFAVFHPHHRKRKKIGFGVVFLLPAIGVKKLSEISLTYKRPTATMGSPIWDDDFK